MDRREAFILQCKLHRLCDGRFVFYDEYAFTFQGLPVLVAPQIAVDYVTRRHEEQ